MVLTQATRHKCLRPQSVLLLIGCCVVGFMRSAEGAGPLRIRNIAGTGQAGFAGDGGPATHARLNNPFGIARGPDGSLYICDTGNHVIRKLDSDGIITTVAGTAQPGHSGDGGPARLAKLHEPYEIRFDRSGHMFFVEMRNHLVRRVDQDTGIITTVAGSGLDGFGGDGGPAIEALMKQPHSIQFDPAGRLLICDIGNHRIRQWDAATGQITTFAGTGRQETTPNGSALAGTPLNGPRAIDFDADGTLWLALREGNAVLTLDSDTLTWQRRAGTGQKGFTGHDGPAIQATLSGPKGISAGPEGKIYLADTESHSIRMVDSRKNTIHLLAGTGTRGDGPEGPARSCRLARPHGVFADWDGRVYIGDSEAHRVRVLESGAEPSESKTGKTSANKSSS